MGNKLIATVVGVLKQTPDVLSINFLVNGKPLPAEAGQYISVYFDDTNVTEGKAYSLSSCPGDENSQITVKRVGLFSNKICNLKMGDTFEISPPYGFFDAFINQPAIFIGCGVGISPLFSIIRNEINNVGNRPMELYYSNKTNDDIIFSEQLHEMSERKNLSVNFYVTREPKSIYYRKRFTVKDLKNVAENTCFYICGTTEFTRSIWRQLVEFGVSEKNISVEVFFGANNGE